MKKILMLSVISMMFSSSVLMAQGVKSYEAELIEAGTLSDVLGDQANEIDSLVVIGPVNAMDFNAILSVL